MTTSEATIHPRVAEVIAALEATQQELVQLLATIPADRIDAPSTDERWSVAQNVEHLAAVEDGVGRMISKLIKQIAESGARETESSSILNSLDQFRVWETRKRIQAPESVAPKASLSTADALAQFIAARTKLIDALRRGSGLALASVTAPHPAVGPINVYQWGLVNAQHVQRHLTQIRVAAGLADA